MKLFLLMSVLAVSLLFSYGVNGASSSKSKVGYGKFEVKEQKTGTHGLSVEYGEFTLDSGIFLNERVRVYYAIPLGKDGKPGPNADNMVFYAPYPNEKSFNRDRITWYTETAGYTTFSLFLKVDIMYVGDRDKMYYYKESGSHDLVFRAQEILRKKFNLKKRKLLVLGRSGGGSMAQQLGVSNPDKIDAIASSGGQRFDLPGKGSKVAFLALNVCSDRIRISRPYEVQQYMKNAGMQMLYTLTPVTTRFKGGKDYSHFSKHDSSLTKLFMQGIVALRDRHNGVLPDFKKWPASSTYDGNKWYFPSVEFAEEWGKFPHEAIIELARDKKHIDKPVYFIPEEKPEAVVVYIHDPAFDNKVCLIDNLYYFMTEHNVVAASVRLSDNYFKSLRNIENLLEDVKARKEWKELPIYVCGGGVGGQLAAIAAFKKGEDIEKKKITRKNGNATITKTVNVRHLRVKKITTINSAYDWPFPELSLGRTAWKLKSRIPLRMVYSPDYQGQIPKSSQYRNVDQLKESRKRRDKGKSNGLSLGKKWFPTLAEIAEGK